MRYQLKLLYAPIKWLSCLMFIMILPIAIYAPTYYDFVNVATLYLPFIGIVLFGDISLLARGSHMEEIVFLANRKPVKTFIQRYILTVIFSVIYIVLAHVIFRIYQFINQSYLVEPISFLQYVLITAGSIFFMGTLTMTVSTLFNNVYISYGLSVIYWMYWNINCQKESLFNPFPFIANPTFFEIPVSQMYLKTLILLAINCFIVRKSPFYLSEKISKFRVRFGKK